MGFFFFFLFGLRVACVFVCAFCRYRRMFILYLYLGLLGRYFFYILSVFVKLKYKSYLELFFININSFYNLVFIRVLKFFGEGSCRIEVGRMN